MHKDKTMKLAVVAFLGISLAAAGTAVAGRGSSPQAVSAGHSVGIARRHQVGARTRRASGLRVVRRHGDAAAGQQQPGHPAGRGLVDRAAWCRADRPGADADPAGAARLGRRAQRGGRAGRVPLRVVHPGPVGGAVEPRVLQRGAGAHGGGPRADLAARGGRAADGGAVGERRRGPGGRDAGPAVDPGLRDGSAVSPLLGNGGADAVSVRRRRRRWGCSTTPTRRTRW